MGIELKRCDDIVDSVAKERKSLEEEIQQYKRDIRTVGPGSLKGRELFFEALAIRIKLNMLPHPLERS